MTTPKVSIIIPNFNKENYVLETLESISNQSYKDWEAIIVDDNSTDNSEAIIRDYIAEKKRFTFLLNDSEISGGSKCRNIGLEKSTGKFIIFLDSDDLLSKNCVENRVSLIGNNHFAVFPMQNFTQEIGDNQFIWNKFSGNLSRRFLMHDLPWQTNMVLWDRDFLLQLNGFNPDFNRLQDVELHTRAVIEANKKFSLHADLKPDCYFRVSEERLTSDYANFLKRWSQGSEKYLLCFTEYLNSKGLSQEVKYLKGTLFSTLSSLSYYFYSGRITKSEFISLFNNLLKSVTPISLLNKKDQSIINAYRRICVLKINKIKGVNYIFRKKLLPNLNG